MTALVKKNMGTDKGGEPVIEYGYHVIGCNTLVVDSRTATLSSTLGGVAVDSWTLSIGVEEIVPDEAIVTPAILRSALLTLVSIWPAPWVRVLGVKVEEGAGKDDGEGAAPANTGPKMFTWMGYLSEDWARGFEPPDDILNERTPDGGNLLIAVNDRPDPTNPEQLRRLEELGALMDSRYRHPWLAA